ncbi:DUF3365 domain-containing protein [Sphingorhabdus sp.]|uniref:c-type heme family protein n=1 Tax=Sphingorhabdus sp. TaxID=1902408 RepID=UPI0037C59251
MMRVHSAMRSLAVLAIFTSPLVLSACATQEPAAADIERSTVAADLFQSRLQTALKSALQNGGPTAAVNVCAEVAPAIAAEVSAETGVELRRISLRPRNPGANTQGELRQRLTSLGEAPVDAAGKPSMINWVEGKGTDATHNSMRAIIMKDEPCAMCHGTAVAADVRAAIAELYPDDAATGYRAGEMRGAILAKIILSRPRMH